MKQSRQRQKKGAHRLGMNLDEYSNYQAQRTAVFTGELGNQQAYYTFHPDNLAVTETRATAPEFKVPVEAEPETELDLLEPESSESSASSSDDEEAQTEVPLFASVSASRRSLPEAQSECVLGPRVLCKYLEQILRSATMSLEYARNKSKDYNKTHDPQTLLEALSFLLQAKQTQGQMEGLLYTCSFIAPAAESDPLLQAARVKLHELQMQQVGFEQSLFSLFKRCKLR